MRLEVPIMKTRLPHSSSVISLKKASSSSGWCACIAMNSSLRAASAGSMTNRSSSPRDAAARIFDARNIRSVSIAPE